VEVEVRLADDRRGRVPFALVGVLLLLSSATFAATLATRHSPVATDRDVASALERATAASGSALRRAVDGASRDAARDPVLAPANTSVGSVVNASSPFRDALRIRIYHAARDRFAATTVRRGAVVAGPELPATPNASTLRQAKRRVRLANAANGTALTVTVADVPIVARRDGSVVARDRETMTLTVDTPVLALHERTARFERRLDRGPVAGPGLGRRLTAQLYVLAWARGYAQYSGVPIENVLGSHHVETAVNAAIVREQRTVFGRADPDAVRGSRRIAAHAAVDDLAVGTGPVATELTRAALADPLGDAPTTGSLPGYRHDDSTPAPDESLTVGVNRTADAAFVGLLDGEDPPAAEESAVGSPDSLDESLAAAYRPEVRLVTAVRRVASGSRPAPEPPGPNWTHTGSDVDHDVRVLDTPDAPTPAVPAGSHRLDGFGRLVVERHSVTRHWRRGNETARTSADWEDRSRVGVLLVGDHVPEDVPGGPVTPVHRRGGALNGPNLAGTAATARSSLVAAQGGRDAVAVGAVRDSLRPGATVTAERPEDLRGWVRADLLRLRDRVRNLSVSVPRDAVAAGRANPPARLAAEVRERRASLLDAPRRYDGAADVARVAARAAYLDQVLVRLTHRATRTATANEGLAAALADAGAPTPDRLLSMRRASTDRELPARSRLAGGLGSPTAVVPDGSPAVLTVAGVDDRHVPEVRAGYTFDPLATRTTNVFTVPSGDAADGVVAELFGGEDTVTLATAARSLAAANGTLADRGPASLRADRDRLRRVVAARVVVARERARRSLRRGTDLSAPDRRTVVRRATRTWRGTAARALAVTNGSFASAVAHEAVAVGATAGPDAPDRATLRTRLDAALSTPAFRERVTVTESVARPVGSTVRRHAEEAVHQKVESKLRDGSTTVVRNASEVVLSNATEAALGAVPAGLPVAPVPGY
jgi:hypothetical protein